MKISNVIFFLPTAFCGVRQRFRGEFQLFYLNILCMFFGCSFFALLMFVCFRDGHFGEGTFRNREHYRISILFDLSFPLLSLDISNLHCVIRLTRPIKLEKNALTKINKIYIKIITIFK